MKKYLPLLASLALFACQNQNAPSTEATGTTTDSTTANNTPAPTADNSRNTLDWKGIYKGTLPCADCSGIETSIELTNSNTFTLHQLYKEKKATSFTEKGKFEWNTSGSHIYCLLPNDTIQYQVGENQLIQLDREGNKITGPLASNYILKKVTSAGNMAVPITNTKWLLKAIENKTITSSSKKELFLLLQAADNRFSAFMGCNNIAGSFEIKGNNTIAFSQGLSTMMACENMQTETAFNQILPTVTSYKLSGNTLQLFVKEKLVLNFVAESK